MSRTKSASVQAPSQRASREGATRPRPRDAAGRELDEFGLPLNGPARVRRLAEMGRPDPNVEPGAWASAGAAPAPGAAAPDVTENGDG